MKIKVELTKYKIGDVFLMPNNSINWTEIFGLLSGSPIILSVTIIVFIFVSAFVTLKPKNKIGKITAKETKLKQSGFLKNNEVDDIKSDNVEITQG